MRPLFSGKVKDGKVIFDDRGRWLKWLEKLEGFEVNIWVDKLEFTRTDAENRYYWGVVVKIASDEMGLIPDEVHELLKSMFLKKGVEYKGERYEIIGSTAKLTIRDFEEYVEKCRNWLMSEGIEIPLPNEVILEI